MTTWGNGKRWVYSITYDEGCADLLKHALPLHTKRGAAWAEAGRRPGEGQGPVLAVSTRNSWF
jgi:hypothetical protein